MTQEEARKYQEWKDQFDGLSFEESAIKIKDKILESNELDKTQRDFFQDTFDYVMGLYHQGKPLDTNLLRINYGIT